MTRKGGEEVAGRESSDPDGRGLLLAGTLGCGKIVNNARGYCDAVFRAEGRTMATFGYSKRVVNEHGLHELSEVTFVITIGDLRRIAAFLIECSEKAESGEWTNSHRHLTEVDRSWEERHPASDVIVVNPNPKLPRGVE